MEGKYGSIVSYTAAKVRRGILRLSLRRLISWGPIENPEPGYTLIIACHGPLAEMVLPNLQQLEKQDLTGFNRMVMAFDRPQDPRLQSLCDEMARRHPQFRTEFLFQSDSQSALLRKIGWGWVDCWLSYCKGIAATKTRYAILHDMDAILLRRDLLRQRFDHMCQQGDDFVGFRWYQGNGLTLEDQIVSIVEMAFDAQYVRSNFKPLDLFNVIARKDGRSLDYDTLLYPQTFTRKRSLVPIDEAEMVHPSQVVSQYTMLEWPDYVPPADNNALFIPYFYWLGGQVRPLEETQAALARKQAKVPLMDRSMDISRLTIEHADWLKKQAMRIENEIAGEPRSEVVAYFDAIREAAEPGARQGDA